MAEMDKMMQELFSGGLGGGAPPDIANLTKLLGSLGSEGTDPEEVSDEKVKEAQKLF